MRKRSSFFITAPMRILFIAMAVPAAAQFAPFPMGGGMGEVCMTGSACCREDEAMLPVSTSSFTIVGLCMTKTTFNQPVDFPIDCNDTLSCLLMRTGGPGFYIDESKRLLTPCEAGYHCPFNDTVGYYNSMIKCASGFVCAEQVTAPYDCGWYNNCNGKTMYAGTGGIALLVILIVVVTTILIIFCIRNKQQLEKSQKLAAKYKDEDVDKFGQQFQGQAESDRNLVTPAFLEFENVGLTLKKAKPGAKPILSGVTGRIPPKSLVALMGPSGCGKTTFMNTILKNTPYGNATGKISINGESDKDIGKMNLVGFVPQDDIVRADLTVFQNLYYNAMIRLPSSTPKEDRLKHVQDSIKVLGLLKVQDNIVGTPESRGVSGGQKKRVNIGMELVAMPTFLFMDEPTSGLDGAATVSLARCMGLLRKSGLTIICVIHQPRWLVFQEFTHVLLLGEGGQTVYWGRQEKLVPYLQGLGFTRPESENPADWMIDVCSGLETRIDPASGQVDNSFRCPEDLYKNWSEKMAPNALKDDFEPTAGDPIYKEGSVPPLTARSGASMLHKIYYMTSRTFKRISAVSVIFELASSFLAVLFISGLTTIILAVLDFAMPVSFAGYAPSTTKFKFDAMYLMLLVISHRADYGDHLLIISRELNSGMGALELWFANALKLFMMVVLKSFIGAFTVYTFQTPFMNFGTYYSAWLLTTWSWAAFTQWFSIFCGTKQITAMLLLILVSFGLADLGFCSGAWIQCAVTIVGYPDSAMNTLCPRASIRSPSMVTFPSWSGYGVVNYWFWVILWCEEMTTYPTWTANNSIVNRTNYWMGITGGYDDADVEADLQSPDYSGRRNTAILVILINVIVHNAVTFYMLYGMQNYVKESSRKDYEETISYIKNPFRIFRICCGQYGTKPPADVKDRMLREEAQEGTVEAQQVAVEMKTA